jgi:hypothetical protein
MDLELNAIQKLQFKKYISEQSGLSLQDVDSYLETIAETEKEDLIKSFKTEKVTTNYTQSKQPVKNNQLLEAGVQIHLQNVQEVENASRDREADEEADDNKPSCPKCKSKQVHAEKKGFSGGKACCGALIAGPLGLLCGTHKQNKVILTCLNCKHSW